MRIMTIYRIDNRLEEVKIVQIWKAYSRESVPHSRGPREEVGLSSCQWNTTEMRMSSNFCR